MSAQPQPLDTETTGRATPPIDTLPDREARNPYFRWLLHLGLPLTLSLAVHLALVLLVGLKTFQVLSRPAGDIGEYEATLTESLADRMRDAFEWSSASALETPDDLTPEPDFDSLTNLPAVSDADLRTSTSDDLGAGTGAGDGLGLGDGALALLGTGSGAGEAGSGGFGAGLGGGGSRLGQAGLWDLTIRANRVAYVIDYSGSIITIVDDLKRELKRSIGRLKPAQSFAVILFYTSGGGVDEKVRTEAFRPKLEPATDDVRREFFTWIDRKAPQGQTEPLQAVKQALALGPEAVFFFSDGLFDDNYVAEIEKANAKARARIYCLLFDDLLIRDTSGLPAESEGSRRLRKIAEASGGKLKIVTGKDLAGK